MVRLVVVKPRGKDGARLAPGIRIAMLIVGLAFLVLAAVLWWTAPEATVQNTTETKVVSTTTEPNRTNCKYRRHRRHRQHCRCVTGTKRTTKTVTTSQILDGRSDQADTAQPTGGHARRSETVTVTLLAGAVLLLMLAAIGRAPSKVSVGGAGAEWAPPLTPDETETLATKVSEKARDRGIQDPKEVGSAVARAYSEALEEKRRQITGQTPVTVAWGTEFVDSYFDKLADKAVSEEPDQ